VAALTALCVVTYTGSGLWADRHVGLPGQLALGALTWVAFLCATRPLAARERLQAMLVVGVATLGEVVGSLIWGLYSYRLHNLPAFVPPGHGLVYVGGVSLAAVAAARPRLLVGAATTALAAWGLAGITILPRPDVVGAFGCLVLIVVLLKTANGVYAGVFFMVAALELYGTAIGTWTWSASVPGLGLSSGNPPSGAASGYVLFDVTALLLAPKVVQLLRGLGRQRSPSLALVSEGSRPR
jgi:hypothetical protein